MITESDMYWLLMLDNICSALGAIVALSVGCSIVSFVAFITATESTHYFVIRRRCKRIMFVCIPIFILSFICAIFVPNTKQMAAIKVIPALVNSSAVQKEVPELYQLGISCLKKQLSTADKK